MGTPSRNTLTEPTDRGMPTDPIAETILPRLGSHPKKAVFTKLELATAVAALLASETDAAPSMETSITLVAPSPSRTMASASSIMAEKSISLNVEKSSLADFLIVLLQAIPLARMIAVSLVLMHPSTMIALKLLLTPSRNA